MKRLSPLLLILLLFLTGCNQKQIKESYTVERDGMQFVVDTENCTITHGEDVYRYAIDENSTTIIYPDDTYFTWNYNEYGATGGGNNFGAEYISNTILVDIAEEAQPRKSETKSMSVIIVSLIVGACGVIMILAPKAAWYLQHGWLFKDAEPSAAALMIGRISGVVLVIFALIILFI